MCLFGDVLYIQIKKWYVKFGATGSLNVLRKINRLQMNIKKVALNLIYED